MTTKPFDVSEPGKTPADPTTRPLVTTRPMLTRDPMVSDSAKTEKVELKVPSSGNKIAVSPTTTGEDVPQPAAEAAETMAPATTESSDSAIVDAVADEAASKKKSKPSDEEKISAEDEARQNHIATLITDKTYFLPIGQVTRKRHARNNLILFLILILVIGGGAYSLYALGLLKSIK